MKKSLLSNDSAWYIYLSKPMLQLLNIDPLTSYLLFKIKDKVLLIEEASEDKIQNLKNPLVKKLAKKGNSWSLYIPVPLLELIDVAPEKDMIDITINEEILFIKKAD
ncbi:MAG: hypothetical protein Q4F80_07960 [bacterium]|nr:hypothetical protein [bacterium]